MSRLALDPRWLIHLPPTMSSSETTIQPGYLEHPAEAFAYYRAQGISRAVLILCRDAAAATRRFGLPAETHSGACYTRTGHQFFEDEALNDQLITRLTDALTASGFWERFATDWACLDAEILPWNAKARGLLRAQYAPVATAIAAVEATVAHGLPRASLLARLSYLRMRHSSAPSTPRSLSPAVHSAPVPPSHSL